MRRRNAEVAVDMFPFISVLCAVIGVLVLILLSLAVTRVAGASLPSGRTELIVPPEPDELNGISEEEYARLSDMVTALGIKLVDRTQQLNELKQLVFTLDDMLAALEDEQLRPDTGDGLLPGIALDQPEDVEFVPVATTDSKRPIFVEARTDTLVVHPAGTVYSLAGLSEKKSLLGKFLEGINHRREYLLILVHPSGVYCYDSLREFLVDRFPEERDKKSSRIKVGYEPYDESWLLVSRTMETREGDTAE